MVDVLGPSTPMPPSMIGSIDVGPRSGSIGGILGHALCTSIAVMGGKMLAERLLPTTGLCARTSACVRAGRRAGVWAGGRVGWACVMSVCVLGVWVGWNGCR